jgi:hypothetical protein
MILKFKSYFVIAIISIMWGCELSVDSKIADNLNNISKNIFAPIELIENIVSLEKRIISYYEGNGFVCLDELICLKSSNEMDNIYVTYEFNINTMTYTYSRINTNPEFINFIDVIISLSTGYGAYEMRHSSLDSSIINHQLIIKNLLTGSSEFKSNMTTPSTALSEETLEFFLSYFIDDMNRFLLETHNLTIQQYLLSQ